MRNTAKVKEGSTVAVFGLGVIGLAVIEARPVHLPDMLLCMLHSCSTEVAGRLVFSYYNA